MKKHDRPFICPVENCGRAFQFKNDLDPRHMKDCHDSGPPQYICVYEGCKTKYGREGCKRLDNMRAHVRNSHGVRDDVMHYIKHFEVQH